MTRDAWLRLAKNVGEIGHGEFGLRQQRQDAQTRLLARSLQGAVQGIETQAIRTHGASNAGAMGMFPLHKDIFIR